MQSNGHRVRLGCEENKEIALAAKRYFCDILEDLCATNKKLKARSTEFSAMLAFVVIPVLSQPRFLTIYSSLDRPSAQLSYNSFLFFLRTSMGLLSHSV